VKLVVGLGNPGKRYQNTPHSVGFEVVDELAARLGCRLRRSWRFRAIIGRTRVGGEELLLAEPQTFMNESGLPVSALWRYYRLSHEDLIVAVDDVDLELGSVRVRPAGGHGGHKGLMSIVERVGTEKFARMRIGVGRSAHGRDIVEHVLSPFPAGERAVVDEVVRLAADAVLCMVEHGVDTAMNDYNSKRPAVAERKVGGQT
jgi:PTH1 family peptidyl-tRNA hydrolase